MRFLAELSYSNRLHKIIITPLNNATTIKYILMYSSSSDVLILFRLATLQCITQKKA